MMADERGEVRSRDETDLPLQFGRSRGESGHADHSLASDRRRFDSFAVPQHGK